jgi:membrane protein YdbS with pleckstrin-like domain
MKKLLRYFLKALSWTVFSALTTWIMATITIQDSHFTLMYACMIAPLIVIVSLGIIPVFMAHEWVWDVGKEEK